MLAVLDDIPKTPQSATSTSSVYSTPKTAGRIQKLSSKLHSTSPYSPTFKYKLELLSKASIAQAHLAAQLSRELEQSQAAINAKKLRNQASRHRVILSTEVQRMKKLRKNVDFVKDLQQWKAKWTGFMKELRQRALALGIITKRQSLSKGGEETQ